MREWYGTVARCRAERHRIQFPAPVTRAPLTPLGRLVGDLLMMHLLRDHAIAIMPPFSNPHHHNALALLFVLNLSVVMIIYGWSSAH
jgi:hypothetical protein